MAPQLELLESHKINFHFEILSIPMIVGVSHLTVACPTLDASTVQSFAKGGEVEFFEQNLPSHSTKSIFLSQSADLHGIAYIRFNEGLPIELVSYYREPVGFPGVFQPYYGTDMLPSVPIAAATAMKKVGGASGLNGVSVASADLVRSVHFWTQALGYRKVICSQDVDSSNAWVVLRRESPIVQWRFNLLLHHGKEVVPFPFLDGPGTTCLAHLSSSIELDLLSLIKEGGEAATEPFEMMINGKKLKIAIVRGPSGEYIELIQVVPQT